MKVTVVSLKPKRKIHWVFKKIKKTTLKISLRNPDIVVSVGGDGTFFEAERRYPGIPKLIVRESQVCHACTNVTFAKALQRIEREDFFIRELDKLGIVGKRCKAVNDVVIRNKMQQEALRFSVKIPGRINETLLIGDGLIIATPFGSSGYFLAVARKTFTRGIGIAFNNIHNKSMLPVQIRSGDIIVKILRGKALVTADNDRKTIVIRERQSVIIRKAREKARIIDF